MLIRTNIYLDKKILDSLRQIAGQEKKSVAEIVRKIIQDAVKKHRAKEKTKNPFTYLIEYAEKNNTGDIEGKTDVAMNHDSYLYVEPNEKKNSR